MQGQHTIEIRAAAAYIAQAKLLVRRAAGETLASVLQYVIITIDELEATR